MHNRVLLVVIFTLLVACGNQASPPQAPPAPKPAAPAAATPEGLVRVEVRVPRDEWKVGVFDTPREGLVPPGWTMSVWATQLTSPRLIAWAPDGAMLVSGPADGTVKKLTPANDGTATVTTLLAGLDKPHGLAFRGDTLYVAETHQLSTYRYHDGAATDQRVIVPNLPSKRSPELHGAYEHMLKSVAIGQDASVYFSIGSTGNVTEQDREADPPLATIMRIPPGSEGDYEVFATGVRNGTGLAIAPDGAVWTAVNNRDQIHYPYDKPYGDAAASSLGQIVQGYVNDHPPELLARLVKGRELGWPYCNADGDREPGEANTAQRTTYVDFINDWGTNPNGEKMDCTTLTPAEQTLGAHSAPLGLSFVNGQLPAPYDRGALVGVHGSWNADPPVAPEVSFLPIQGTGLAPQRTLVGGFQGPDGTRWGRPRSCGRRPGRRRVRDR
jgi:glucose/arabinose dehydrogenase